MEWDGPSVVMVNGQKAPPLGAIELEIEHQGKRASGRVLVLEMRGIELLLGNDFLSQFKLLQINYDAERPELLLGSIVEELAEEEERGSSPKIVTKLA